MTVSNTRHEATIQMYAAVGRAITEWGFVEERLFHLYATCAGATLPLGKTGIQFVDSEVPMWVFYSLETFHAKRRIVDAAVIGYVQYAESAAELREEWGKLSQKGRDLARLRNKLAHWFVLPAQPRGTGAPEEGFSPARLMPPRGSPDYWRATGLSHDAPRRKSLTENQIGHMGQAFYLYSEKVRRFTRKLLDTKELRDTDVQQALHLLVKAAQSDPSVRAQIEAALASRE